MDVREYFALVARHWRVLTGSVLVGLVAGVVAVAVQTPEYDATAQVVFTAHTEGDGQDLAYAGTYVQARMQTYKDLATSPTVLAPVTDALDLDESPQRLAERTHIEVSQLDTTMLITVRDPSAKAAARTADAAADALIAAVGELETTRAGSGATVEGVVVGQAVTPDDPAHPNRPLHLGAGLLLGLLAGIAVVATLRLATGARRTGSSPAEAP